MRQFTGGPTFVRGLTAAEKTAAWQAAKALGLRSISDLCCWLVRQHLAQLGRKGKPAKPIEHAGASSITREIAQWRIPGQGEPKEKNSPPARPRNNSDAAVRASTPPEA